MDPLHSGITVYYEHLPGSNVNLHGAFLLHISNIYLLTYPIQESLLECITIIIIRMITANIY